MNKAELLKALEEIEAIGVAKVHLSTTPRRWRMVHQIRTLSACIKEEPEAEVLAEKDAKAWRERPWDLHEGWCSHLQPPCIPVHVTITRREAP